jgi:hypothetical protein
LSVILLGNKVDGGLDLVVGKLMLVDDVFEVRQGIGTEGVTVFAKDLDRRDENLFWPLDWQHTP